MTPEPETEPAVWTVPLAFSAMIVASLLTQGWRGFIADVKAGRHDLA